MLIFTGIMIGIGLNFGWKIAKALGRKIKKWAMESNGTIAKEFRRLFISDD